MKISTTVQGYMQTFLLTEQEAYFAMLIAAGATQGEAYCVIYNNSNSPEVANSSAFRIMKRKAGIGDLINTLRAVTMKGVNIEEPVVKNKRRKSNDVDLRSKDGIIDALSDQLKFATDPKTKADIIMKTADLQRMKQDDNKDEEELVHFYSPLNCPSCNLYIAERKRRMEEENNNN